jgi:hypothetical protein
MKNLSGFLSGKGKLAALKSPGIYAGMAGIDKMSKMTREG